MSTTARIEETERGHTDIPYETFREALSAERERAQRAEAQVAALEARIEALEATMENHVVWYPTCPWGR